MTPIQIQLIIVGIWVTPIGPRPGTGLTLACLDMTHISLSKVVQ